MIYLTTSSTPSLPRVLTGCTISGWLDKGPSLAPFMDLYGLWRALSITNSRPLVRELRRAHNRDPIDDFRTLPNPAPKYGRFCIISAPSAVAACKNTPRTLLFLLLIEERRIVFDIICCFFNISERKMYKPEMKRRLVSPTLRKIHLVMFLRKTEGKGDSRLADNNITSATMWLILLVMKCILEFLSRTDKTIRHRMLLLIS